MNYFVVECQALENYEYNSNLESDAFWKFKGGSDYLVEAEREQDAVALVYRHVADADSMGWREFPIRWSTYGEWLDRIDDHCPDHCAFMVSHLVELKLDSHGIPCVVEGD